MRQLARSLSRAALLARSQPLDTADLEAAAVVFSPHPDDESLACGGTVIRKRAQGAPVDLVFMTDGSASHRKWVDGGELRARRMDEARNAARVLGVEAERVTFLDVEDGTLLANWDTVRARIEDVLSRSRPVQVFVPYVHEPPPDHWVTREVVVAALSGSGAEATVLEYPVWLWHHWPWTPGGVGAGKTLHRRVGRNLRATLWLLRDFNVRVDISEVEPAKREALACHRTQMTRFEGLEDWPILADVGGGEFLRCFFQGIEVFHRWRHRPTEDATLDGEEQSGA